MTDPYDRIGVPAHLRHLPLVGVRYLISDTVSVRLGSVELFRVEARNLIGVWPLRVPVPAIDWSEVESRLLYL